MSGAERVDIDEATRPPIPRTFQQLLVNTLMTGVTSSRCRREATSGTTPP